MKKTSVPATLSIVFCGIVFVGSLGLLALTSYHLWNDNDSGNVPMEQSDEWITHVIALIPICVIFMLLCVFCLWVILVKDRMRCFIAILVLNFLCLITAVYFAVVFSNELDTAPISGDLLFNRTKSAISDKAKQNKKRFVPAWLDSIQKQSKECCGIKTFRDWEEFWPEEQTQVPHSCCRNAENNNSFCPTDLSLIPFPGTPSMFIKTDTGCLDEINDLTKKNIKECFIYVVLMCCVLAVTEGVYFVQFYRQYVPKKAGGRGRCHRGKNDKFGDEKGPQGDDGCEAPNCASTDSYLQNSGFTASLTSADSGGVNPDPNQAMNAYDPIALSATASGSEFAGRQRSLARMQQGQHPGQKGFGGVNSNTKVGGYDINAQPDENALASSSSTELDGKTGKKKKSKKHRKHKDVNNDATATDSDLKNTGSRQEVFIAPDQMEDFLVDPPVQEATFGAQGQASPTASLDDVGDQLADNGARPAAASPKKKLFGLGNIGNLARRHH